MCIVSNRPKQFNRQRCEIFNFSKKLAAKVKSYKFYPLYFDNYWEIKYSYLIHLK